MRVTVTRRITAGAVVMFEIDTYDIGALSLSNTDTAAACVFSSVVSLEDIYEQIINGGEWVKGHLQATQTDANGADIYAELDGDQLDEVYSVEVFG